jgi:hypothetical protein
MNLKKNLLLLEKSLFIYKISGVLFFLIGTSWKDLFFLNEEIVKPETTINIILV